MTQFDDAPESGGAADLPPGSAPAFGDVPATPFEPEPEHLVLSSDEHSHLSGPLSLTSLSGEFNDDSLGRGRLVVSTTGQPGEVHVHVSFHSGYELDADVRESWLARAAAGGGSASLGARVAAELLRLSEIPHQSTVVVRARAS